VAPARHEPSGRFASVVRNVTNLITSGAATQYAQGRPEDENQGGVNNLKNTDYSFFTQCM